MNKKVLFLSLLAGMFAIVLSCSGEHPGFKKTKSGIFYKIHVDNADGRKPESGEILTMEMIYRTEDSVLFSSIENRQPMILPLSPKQYDGDIFEALAMLKVGDSATFIIDASAFFLQTAGMQMLPEFITEESKLFFDVKLNKALSEKEMQDEHEALRMLRKELEPQELAEYLTANSITTAPTASGLYFIEKETGTGPMVQNGDKVTVHFEISTLAGKQLYSTYDAGQPLDVEVGQRFDTEGVTEALAMVRKGTSATLIIPSELAFGPEGSGEAIPPYTTMLYNINVVEVTTKEQIQKEQEQIQKEMQMKEQQSRTNEGANILKYMEDNNLSGTPTKSGLYYIEKERGSGAKPQSGQTVQVHYTGTLLDGSKFDSSVDRGQPFEFVIGRGQVIQGWDEGIALMNIGSKGLLIVPFELGYGSRDMSPQIPAYSTLVFEVELLGIK